MAYNVARAYGPARVTGEVPEWENRFPDVNDRLKIATTLMKGDRLLPLSEAPRVLVLPRKRKQLPDFFESMSGLVVSEAFRLMLEDLDPGIHQFWPLEIERGPEGAFWGLNVHIHQRSIIEELSDVEPLGVNPPADRDKATYPMMLQAFWKRLTVRKSALGPVNLWREHLYLSELFASDRLIAEIKSRKLKSRPMKRIDEV